MWTCQKFGENTVNTRLSTAITASIEGLKYELDSPSIRFLAELTGLPVAINLLFTSENASYPVHYLTVSQLDWRLETYQLNNRP